MKRNRKKTNDHKEGNCCKRKNKRMDENVMTVENEEKM